MTLLLDIGDVPECHCNDMLDGLFKAMSESGTNAPTIWTPIDQPLIRDMVEDVTERFQGVIEAIRNALSHLMAGDRTDLQKADVPWERWSPVEFERVRERLSATEPASYTLDDWLMVVDWLLQRYLGPDVIATEAEHIAARSALLGKIQASMPHAGGTDNMPDHLVEDVADVWQLLPTKFAKIPPKVLTPLENTIMRTAQARVAIHISSVTEGTRARLKTVILEHAQAQILGQKEGRYTALATRLFDEFATLNMDFRRIAVTEVGEAVNQGFIAAQPIGSSVKRLEAYRGACEFCRSINGRIFRVVDPAAPDKSGTGDVWVGKSNVGRSASPRKRVGSQLMERGEAEMWWPAAGLQHPHCRGSWSAVSARPANVDPAFWDLLQKRKAAMLKEVMDRTKAQS